jgi:ribosome biogenesis protein BMS1
MPKNQEDSSKSRIPTKYADVEEYVKSVKSRFMAGTTIKEDEPAEQENLENSERVIKAGIQKGTYVKIELEGLNEEIFSTINADKPLILCGVKALENVLGLLRGRVKNHKWNKKILKNENPVIMSVGWQRFQTLPMFCTEDLNTERIRMLKYTPKYSFCGLIFFGPFVPVNTPFLAMSDINSAEFRISAIGTILELSHSYSIYKKLKLIGEPYQIFKNTAYIKGMFNSQLEVSKFLGAKLKTVSGIRGMIKKAARQGLGPDGTFRATFEDKILMSDIVFLRTYYHVKPKKFYNPLVNFSQQRLLKSVSDLRKEKGIFTEDRKDSHYIPIVRKERNFAPLKIPAKIEKNLPFKNKNKEEERKEDVDPNLEVLMNEREIKIASFLKRLENVKDIRMKKEKEKQEKRQEIIVKKQKIEEEKIKESLQRRIKNRMKKSKNRKKAFDDHA